MRKAGLPRPGEDFRSYHLQTDPQAGAARNPPGSFGSVSRDALMLGRKLIDFHHRVPDTPVSAFHDCGVVAGHYRDQDGRLEIGAGRKASALEGGGLLVLSPIVIGLDRGAIAVVNFKEWIGEGIRNTEGA